MAAKKAAAREPQNSGRRWRVTVKRIVRLPKLVFSPGAIYIVSDDVLSELGNAVVTKSPVK